MAMHPRPLPTQLLALAGWFLLTFAAAGVGAAASVDAQAFYARLAKPAWAPPASVFGPVWTVLYALMAVAAWLVWRTPGRKGRAIGLFVAQLAANALWSWLFFGWRLGALASVEVVVLLVLIGATMAAFWQHSRAGALLLVPYAAWVAFATALTWAVWRGNPDLL